MYNFNLILLVKNDAHIHLLVNHLPIILPAVGVLLLVTGFLAKSEAVKRTGFMILILGAIFTIFAMKSGEGAEDVIKKLDEASKDYVHAHEEKAETFALLSYILGALSIFALWASFKRKSFSNILTVIALIFALVVMYYAKQTGETGGEIRHTEIRNDQSKFEYEMMDAESE